VNAFAVAAAALLLGFLPLGVVLLREAALDAVVALELCGSMLTLALVCLAESFHRSTYFTVAVVCAVLSGLGGLVYVRFLGPPDA
jgi:multisubunit Na+/H+ antiporter MnhF subunit